MIRIIGIFIIVAGLALLAYGALPLVIIVFALITGKPVPSFPATGRLIGGGLVMIGYGWWCVKGAS